MHCVKVLVVFIERLLGPDGRCLSVHKVAEGITVDGILENWVKIKPVIMEEWSENRDELIDLFGKVRDNWIEKDLATWIGANRYSISSMELTEAPFL